MNDDLYSPEDLERMNATLKEMRDEVSRTHTVALPPEPVPKRMHDTSNFPNIPVDPAELALKVTEKLNSFKDVVTSVDTPIMVEELCRSFNECIRLNKAGEAQTLILSPKTGSAKSVSSQMYVSLLEVEASIVVVYTIEDAIETCKNINEWSGNEDYARCTYSLSGDNNNDLRVNIDQLSQYRCIVISHALFKLANDAIGIESLSTYKDQKREFVLVDERMDLHKDITFPLSNIKPLLKLFNDIKHSIELPLVDNEIKYLESVLEIFEEFKEISEMTIDIVDDKIAPSYEQRSFMYVATDMRSAHDIKTHDFSIFQNLLKDKIVKLEKIIDPLSLLDSKVETNKVIKKLMSHLKNLATILSSNFYYFAQASGSNGPMIMITKNILNEFGSSVVLDATATVNRMYDDKVLENPDTVRHIETTNPRKYNNFTINACRGVKQGKHSIYKSLTPNELKQMVELYKEIAYSLLTNKDDCLLVVVHQDFREELKKKITKKAVEFTHWGDHRGKNKWSHCNKMLVIGWNYLPTQVHYLNFINAINGTHDINNQQLRDIRDTYSLTQITDDLVQAVNRGAVRKTASTDGNCKESEVYMFYPTGVDGKIVMDLFKKEFEGANEKPWTPVGIEKIQSLSKNYATIEKVANYIERKVNELGEIKQSVVQKYFDEANNPERLAAGEDRIPRNTAVEAVRHVECIYLLNTKGIHRVPYNSKSFKFKRIT